MKNLKSPFLSASINKNNSDSNANKEEENLVPNISEHILEHNLEEWREKVYSIALLLTGSANAAEFVAQEVMESLSEYKYTNQDYNITKFEEKIRKLAYDASIESLFNQVKSKAKDLEDSSNNILEEQNYLN